MTGKQGAFFEKDRDGFPVTGEQRRDEGVARRVENDPDWHAQMLSFLRIFAACRTQLTSDSFRDWAEFVHEPQPNHPNSWGALFNSAAKAGWLRDTGRTVKTRRKTGQARRLVVWEWAG